MKTGKEIACYHDVMIYFDDLKPEVQEELIGLYGEIIKEKTFGTFWEGTVEIDSKSTLYITI